MFYLLDDQDHAISLFQLMRTPWIWNWSKINPFRDHSFLTGKRFDKIIENKTICGFSLGCVRKHVIKTIVYFYHVLTAVIVWTAQTLVGYISKYVYKSIIYVHRIGVSNHIFMVLGNLIFQFFKFDLPQNTLTAAGRPSDMRPGSDESK